MDCALPSTRAALLADARRRRRDEAAVYAALADAHSTTKVPGTESARLNERA